MQQISLSRKFEGQWLNIYGNLGIEKFTNKPCPYCGGENRASVLDSGILYCRQCGSHDPVSFITQIKGLDFVGAAKLIEGVANKSFKPVEIKPDATIVNRQLQGIKPIKGTLAEKYLLLRNCPIPDKDVFFQPRGWAVKDGKIISDIPCMLSLAKDKDGNLRGIHKTFLNSDGTKHKLDKQISKIKGLDFLECAVQLFSVKQTMGIAEGIETALSAYKLFSIPTWAATNRIVLESFRPPHGVKFVTVFSDNDASFDGQLSAFALAKRLRKEGYNVNVSISTLNDFNDDLRNL